MKNTEEYQLNYTSILILRIATSSIFIVASLSHLFQIEKTVNRIAQAKFGFIGQLLGPPEIAVVASGILMLISGLSLALGYKTRYAAILLIAILIPITITIQVGQLTTLGPLFKNVAILGGLLFFTMNPKFKKQK